MLKFQIFIGTGKNVLLMGCPQFVKGVSYCAMLLCAVMPLLSSMHTCPASDQYTFSCSTCLSFSMSNSTYSAASQECEGQGGALVTVHNDLQWNMLQLYLESLNLTGMWIGYR